MGPVSVSWECFLNDVFQQQKKAEKHNSSWNLHDQRGAISKTHFPYYQDLKQGALQNKHVNREIPTKEQTTKKKQSILLRWPADACPMGRSWSPSLWWSHWEALDMSHGNVHMITIWIQFGVIPNSLIMVNNKEEVLNTKSTLKTTNQSLHTTYNPWNFKLDTSRYKNWWFGTCVSFQACLFLVSMLNFRAVFMTKAASSWPMSLWNLPAFHQLPTFR